jgi:multicomponent Na+:H+ antiporter subunit D
MEYSPNLLVILPIMIPFAGAAVGLLLRNYRRVQALWTLGAITLSCITSIILLWVVWSTGSPLIFQVGAWPYPVGITIVGDILSATMVVMAQIVLAFGILYAQDAKDQVTLYPTFYPLFLTLSAGLTGAMLTGDLFNLFVFTELLVVSAAILTAISDDKMGTEAAYKYFYISLLAATFLLLSAGALYASYGTLNMADLAQRIAANPDQPMLPIAVVFLMAFFMVKSAVIPFHFWQPDFHTAAPTPVHAVLSSVVVKLGIYGFLRMTTLLFLEQAVEIRTVLVVLGVLGIFFGGLGATGTYDAKRMLAYSTLGQLGFILVAIGWGTPLALVAAVVYSFNHSLLKSAMLMLAGSVASRAPIKTAAFTAIRGLGKTVPFAGVLFLLGGMGLAGIPPMNGFVSKFMVFQSGIEAEEYIPLALLALASIITLVYTTRAFQTIWWDPLPGDVIPKKYGDSLIAPALLISLCVILGLWGEPLLQLAQANAAWMSNPDLYIQAVIGG